MPKHMIQPTQNMFATTHLCHNVHKFDYWGTKDVWIMSCCIKANRPACGWTSRLECFNVLSKFTTLPLYSTCIMRVTQCKYRHLLNHDVVHHTAPSHHEIWIRPLMIHVVRFLWSLPTHSIVILIPIKPIRHCCNWYKSFCPNECLPTESDQLEFRIHQAMVCDTWTDWAHRMFIDTLLQYQFTHLLLIDE